MLILSSYGTTEHQSWLVPVTMNAYEGDSLTVLYCFGNEFTQCGILQNEDLSVYAVTPEGKRQSLEMNCSKEDCFTYRIKVGGKGLYHIIAEQLGYFSEDAEGRLFRGTFEDNPEAVSATRYLQYAHTALQVGSNLISEDRAKVQIPPLCIVPDSWDKFRAGEVFAFTLYFRGRPLPLYDIDISYIADNGKMAHTKSITNGSGRMIYPINTPGKYLVVVSYTSPECEEGLYYNTKYIYSFWFKAINQS